MDQNTCDCCKIDNTVEVFSDSFFDLPILKCNNCSGYFVKNKNEIDLKKYYNETYWDIFRNIDKKKITEEKTDEAYLLKKFPKFIQILIESTGIKKALAYSQYDYLKNRIKIGKLLEIGSGQGYILEIFEKNGFKVSGIEPSRTNVEIINKKLKNGKCKHGFAESEIDHEVKFDLIIMSHVLEHVIDSRKVLEKLKTVLTNDGHLFIEVPNCSSKKYLEESIYTQPHIQHFTKESIQKLLESIEMKIVKVDTLNGEVNSISKNLKYFIFWIFKKNYFYPINEKEGKYLRIIAKKK
jgi:2-polyprenyl-3-methyl-5-hydroxy-6-metoxy-1,4-benzoquinol methylase